MSQHEEASLFERLRKGLSESIAHSKGELSLVTTELPAPPPRPDPARIVSLRKQYRMSQAVFAAVVNVSVKTVQSWEQGLRRPSDAALRMLQVIRREPDVVERILSSAWHPKQKKAVTRRGREDRPRRKVSS